MDELNSYNFYAFTNQRDYTGAFPAPTSRTQRLLSILQKYYTSIQRPVVGAKMIYIESKHLTLCI